MGLMDNLVNAAKNELEATKAKSQKQAECSKDRSLALTISFGYREIGISSLSTMRQKISGEVYFNYDDSSLYRLIGYEWGGPKYEIMTTSNTSGTSNTDTEKKGKSGRMATGAIIGTMLFPGVGTVVGAAIGAGGKSKSKSQTTKESSSQQLQKHVEKNTSAILKLKRIDDNTPFSITVLCNSNIDSQLRCFNLEPESSTASVSKDMTDALKGIKALKELLDMGAITQDEFDIKKKQLLNQ